MRKRGRKEGRVGETRVRIVETRENKEKCQGCWSKNLTKRKIRWKPISKETTVQEMEVGKRNLSRTFRYVDENHTWNTGITLQC